MLDRLTPPTRHALAVARATAGELGAEQADLSHLLRGLRSTPGSAAERAISRSGLRGRELLPDGAYVAITVVGGEPSESDPPLSPEVQESIRRAEELADEMRHAFVGTEHVLLSLSELAGGPLGELLSTHGLTPVALRAALFESGSGAPQ